MKKMKTDKIADAFAIQQNTRESVVNHIKSCFSDDFKELKSIHKNRSLYAIGTSQVSFTVDLDLAVTFYIKFNVVPDYEASFIIHDVMLDLKIFNDACLIGTLKYVKCLIENYK